MGKHIIFIEKDLDEAAEKKVKSNLRKINNSLHQLYEMGYKMYLAMGMLYVCDGDTHFQYGDYTYPDSSVVVASIAVKGIDGGDW